MFPSNRTDGRERSDGAGSGGPPSDGLRSRDAVSPDIVPEFPGADVREGSPTGVGSDVTAVPFGRSAIKSPYPVDGYSDGVIEGGASAWIGNGYSSGAIWDLESARSEVEFGVLVDPRVAPATSWTGTARVGGGGGRRPSGSFRGTGEDIGAVFGPDGIGVDRRARLTIAAGSGMDSGVIPVEEPGWTPTPPFANGFGTG